MRTTSQKINELQNKNEFYFSEMNKKDNEIYSSSHKINEQQNQLDRQREEI